MIKYKVRNNFVEAKIELIEVVRETDKSIVLPKDQFWSRERTERKESEYTRYFDTWASAYEFLIDKSKRHISNLEDNLRTAISTHADLLRLRGE